MVCPGQFMLGMPSDRKPCAQSSQLRSEWYRPVSASGDAVRRDAFLVEVDGDVRNQRLPLCLHQHLRIIERTG